MSDTHYQYFMLVLTVTYKYLSRVFCARQPQQRKNKENSFPEENNTTYGPGSGPGPWPGPGTCFPLLELL